MKEVIPSREPDAPVNVHSLRRPSAPADLSQTSDRAALLAALRNHRVPHAIAHDLAMTAAQSGLSQLTLALACALDRRMKAAPLDLAANKALLLVGPYGAGKTAVAAKIAATARIASRALRLFAFHPGETGAAARLENSARETDTPFAIVQRAEMLSAVVAGCVKKNTLAVVDTAGFDPRSGKARTAFAALTQIADVECVGIVSATGDAEEVSEIAAALAAIGARRSIVTGVDMTARLGAVVAAATSALPLAHIACSPQVSAGLEAVTPLSLARALLGADGESDGPQ